MVIFRTSVDACLRSHCSMCQWRLYTTTAAAVGDLRVRLMSEVKTALKQKDTVRSTTLRSALSEVYAADKTANMQVTSATIVGILRKGIARRQDAAAKFKAASREDLANKEIQESDILSSFLPSLLSEANIDVVLSEIIQSFPGGSNPLKPQGQIFKEFYSKVDKSNVDAALVKQRVQVLLGGRT